MSDDPEEQSLSSTVTAVVVGLLMVGFAVWVVAGSGLFSGAPAPVPAAQALAAAKKISLDDLPSAGSTPKGDSPPLNTPTADASRDPLMAEIVAKLSQHSAVPGEALLTFRDKAALAEFLKQAKKYGLEVVSTLNGLNTARVRFNSPDQLHDYLASTGQSRPELDANHWMTVPRLARPDTNNQGGAAPSGVDYLQAINAVGDRTNWGQGVTVAVLDTGVKSNPTFGANQVTHVDLVDDGTPFHSHGTSVASLIAGQDDRVPGVSPDANILDIRVANSQGYSVTSVLAQGLVEAANRGAQVINISMGGYDDSTVLREAVAYALQKGAIIVAAAGNEKYDQLAYPAAIPGVMSAGAVDASNQQAYFSNSGSGLSYVAPGVGLPVAWGADQMAIASGTSQAAGVVSGAFAYYLGLGLSVQEAERRMQAGAKATGAPPNQVGHGVVQVRK